MIVRLLALAWSAQASSAAQDNAEVWHWDAKAPICTLKQQVPTAAGAVTIERTPGGEETELLITLPAGSKLDRGHFLDAAIGTDSGRTFLADVTLGVDSDRRSVLYVDSPDPTFIENLSGTSSLNVSYGKNKSVRVPINVPAKVIATLRDCEDTTMRGWGIDPLAWRSLQSRPLSAEHVRERFNELDYPPEALAANVEADAVIRLDVASDGSVANCAAVNSGLPKAFEIASCKVLRGAKFRPAKDSDGKPTSAPVVYDVRFRIGS